MSKSYPDLMKHIDITLEDPDGRKLHFPVNPDEIKISRERSLETLQLLRQGEADLPGGERIKEISFSSFFPVEYDAGYCRTPDIPNPQLAMNQLNTWMNDRRPLRLIITPTEVNVLVLLSSHHSMFRGGEAGDVYFDVTFRTWRDYRIRTVEEASGGQAGQRPDVKPVPKLYTVQPGDSLWSIAKLQLGDGSRWKQLYERNTDVIGPNPDRIIPGQKLVMPS